MAESGCPLKYVLLVVVLCVSGCVSTDASMQSWLGANQAELLAAWGTPDWATELEGGGRTLTWVRFYGVPSIRRGRQSFTISGSGTVVDYSFHNMPSPEGGSRHDGPARHGAVIRPLTTHPPPPQRKGREP